MLSADEIDFGISAFSLIPDPFQSEILVDDTYVLIMRRGHLLAKGRLALGRYAAARHMLFSPRGEAHGFVDTSLHSHGLCLVSSFDH